MTDWETRYYEAEASHTEANGMLTAENERLKRLHTDAFHEAQRWKERYEEETLRHQSGRELRAGIEWAISFLRENGFEKSALALEHRNVTSPHQVSKEPQAVWETNPRAAYDAAKALAEAVRADVPIIRPELKAALDRVRWLDSIPLPPDSQSVAGNKP